MDNLLVGLLIGAALGGVGCYLVMRKPGVGLQSWVIEDAARLAIAAVEQIMAERLKNADLPSNPEELKKWLEGLNREKLQLAIDFVRDYLTASGAKFDVDSPAFWSTVEMTIEALIKTVKREIASGKTE